MNTQNIAYYTFYVHNSFTFYRADQAKNSQWWQTILWLQQLSFRWWTAKKYQEVRRYSVVCNNCDAAGVIDISWPVWKALPTFPRPDEKCSKGITTKTSEMVMLNVMKCDITQPSLTLKHGAKTMQKGNWQPIRSNLSDGCQQVNQTAAFWRRSNL